MPASSTVRAAVVQAASVAFDREQTLEKARDLAADAARQGARVVLFPEAFVAGYPRGASFGTVVGARTDEGREAFRRYWASAVDVPGPAVDALGGLARDHGIYLVMGVIEREGGTLYCAVLFFARTGRYLGKHRKLMPTAAERLVWGYGDGSTLPVFATEVGKLGAVICWENYMPLLRTAMYGKGIELYCAPTADGRDSWLATVRHIACEGRCFVLSCNQFARRRDYPPDFATSSGLPSRLRHVVRRRPGNGPLARRQLHCRSPRGSARRPRLRGGDDPRRRPRPRPDRAGEVRPRRRRPLRAPRRLPARSQRAAGAAGRRDLPGAAGGDRGAGVRRPANRAMTRLSPPRPRRSRTPGRVAMDQHRKSDAVVGPTKSDDEMTEQERERPRERFRQATERIAERNADKDPDGELAFITEVVEEVRREPYERERQAPRARRAVAAPLGLARRRLHALVH